MANHFAPAWKGEDARGRRLETSLSRFTTPANCRRCIMQRRGIAFRNSILSSVITGSAGGRSKMQGAQSSSAARTRTRAHTTNTPPRTKPDFDLLYGLLATVSDPARYHLAHSRPSNCKLGR